MVEVTSLVIGCGASVDIDIVCLPCQEPAAAASSACILPGVPASAYAFISSGVQPGGSDVSGLCGAVPAAGAAAAPAPVPAAGCFVSPAAMANAAATVDRPTTATNAP